RVEHPGRPLWELQIQQEPRRRLWNRLVNLLLADQVCGKPATNVLQGIGGICRGLPLARHTVATYQKREGTEQLHERQHRDSCGGRSPESMPIDAFHTISA